MDFGADWFCGNLNYVPLSYSITILFSFLFYRDFGPIFKRSTPEYYRWKKMYVSLKWKEDKMFLPDGFYYLVSLLHLSKNIFF